MKVALGQFAVAREWETNLVTCQRLMTEAQQEGADLLVLPEGVLARDITDPHIVRRSAQPLAGPFVSQLLASSKGNMLTTMMCIHLPVDETHTHNVLIAIRNGEVIAQYRKLHLYDAFAMQESKSVYAGDEVPPLLDIAGFKVGLMTCYDVRFPEMARRLVLDGAEALIMPAAWVKGPLKEAHWQVLVTARALENTTYMVAVGECGERNIGASMVVDPLGVAVVRAAEAPALIYAILDKARLEHARHILPVLQNRRFAGPQLQSNDQE